MSDYGWGMFKKGLKRRKKEVARMRIIACISALLLVFLLLLQDNVNAFQMELNYKRFGRWAVSAPSGSEIPYSDVFNAPTDVFSGPQILRTYPLGGESDIVIGQNEHDDGSTEFEFAPVTDADGNPLPLSPEITVLSENGRRFTGNSLGCMPEDFAKRNGIELYEGHMPENDDEIAAELSVLQTLGYDYELGQLIQFYIPTSTDTSDSTLHLKLYSFKLVGTVKRYSLLWASDGTPNAFVTDKAFELVDAPKSSASYYEFKDQHDGPDIWEFAMSMFDRIGTPDPNNPSLFRITEAGDRIRVNTSTYSGVLWGSPTVFHAVRIFFLLICGAIMIYLMSAYLAKRRGFFLKTRELGATMGEVFSLAAYECVVSVIPFAAIMIAAAYFLATIICSLLSRMLDVPFTFVFRAKTFLLAVGLLAVLFGVSLLASLVVFAGRGLQEKKSPLSRRSTARLRKRATVKRGENYIGLSESLKRDRASHKIRTWALRLVSILVCGITIFAATKMTRGIYFYLKVRDWPAVMAESGQNDNCNSECIVNTEPHWNSSATKRITSDKVYYDFGNFYSMENVIEESMLAELSDIQGIAKVRAMMFDCKHYLTWDGAEEDAFINYCAENALRGYQVNGTYEAILDEASISKMKAAASKAFYRIFCFDDPSEIWHIAQKYLNADVMDYDAFLRGEQVILLVDETAESVVFHDEENEYTAPTDLIVKYPLSLKAGSEVYVERVNTKKEKRSLPVTITGVLPLGKTGIDAYLSETIDGQKETILFSVVGSAGFGQRIMQEEGMEYGPNIVQVYLNGIGRRDMVSGEVVKILNKPDMLYTDYTEQIKDTENTMIENLLTYGTFAVALVLLWAFVMCTVASEEGRRHLLIMKDLAALGAAREDLCREKKSDAAKQSLCTLLTVPIYTFISGGLFVLRQYKDCIDPDRFRMTPSEAIKSIWGSIATPNGRELLLNSGNCAIQVTVIVALLFFIVLYLINRKLDYKGRDFIEIGRSK